MKLDELLRQRDFQGAIFDMDGLIVDSEELTIIVAADLLSERFGVTLTAEERAVSYGEPDIYLFQRAVRKYGLDADPQELLQEHYKRENERLSELQLLPGIERVLRTLELQKALCSGSTRYKVDYVQDKFDLRRYFRVSVAEQDTKLHKPNPDPYIESAKQLGVDPKHCLAFEDSDNGVVAAKAAGLYCVGVLVGNHGITRLEHADVVIPTFEALF